MASVISFSANGAFIMAIRNVTSKFWTVSGLTQRGIAGSVVSNQCVSPNNEKGKERATDKPKRLVVDPETSIHYMESNAYKEAYGDKPVWFHYRRNFKGQIAPETRRTCIRQGKISTGSPCPVCRDEYLVLNYKNVKLLNQFICPYTGEVLATKKTGICQKQQFRLLIAVQKAQDCGYLEKSVPFRIYDYSQYWDSNKEEVL